MIIQEIKRLISEIEYKNLYLLQELFDEELFRREQLAFDKFYKDCENRSDELDRLCTKCPVFSECITIRDYEDITGKKYEEIFEVDK